MRRPRLARNIALGFFVFGLIVSPGVFLIPDGTIPRALHSGLAIAGLTSLILGGTFALVQHEETRAQDRLRRGEGVLARWRIDPLAWKDFLALNHQASAEQGALPNQLTPVKETPPEGIEIVVARDGVEVGGDFQHVPFRGTPRVESVYRLRNNRSAGIELILRYPTKFGSTRLALRYPLPAGDEELAARLLLHYQASEQATRGKPALVFRNPKLSRAVLLTILLLCAASFAGGLLLKEQAALGDLPLYMAVIGAVAGIGAALLLLIMQIALAMDARRQG
ncbi:MAG TPA: hypothetical protein VHA10_21500 [Hypericibacter adhaerens]|jgi:hypothetical protein|uniref:Uncharacterized protein n=1 Tax=Hypericibacter adhaerens TaxID=2602016 RepID=A0A5J6N443_9PROT|nr:hypothetical protein [Hypericibacter adhaerens]QEX24599.1 hypothetical protein FRZ61_45400 [Hypericibacter adhaerens]HWA45810.1 hypothetical protein [Hypericibacter adhaerens]